MALYKISIGQATSAARKLQHAHAKDRADEEADYGEHDSRSMVGRSLVRGGPQGFPTVCQLWIAKQTL